MYSEPTDVTVIPNLHTFDSIIKHTFNEYLFYKDIKVD
jgi:hypothetical protein